MNLMTLAVFAVAALMGSGVTQAAAPQQTPAHRPTSIIFVIGDGMGPAYLDAWRRYRDDPATPLVEPTPLDAMSMAMVTTRSQDSAVTDSAAAATALASGVKTKNGYVGIDKNKQDLLTVLEQAKLQGYRTGVVVTSPVTHATPASFIANHDQREQQKVIARQYLHKNRNGVLKFDLLMGGGRADFLQSQRNLIAELQREGFTYVSEWSQLNSLARLPAVALFSPGQMEYVINSPAPQRQHLHDMTEKALSLLQDRPFFLLVEASLIDWCGHDNDIACALSEMDDLMRTVEMLKRHVDQHPDTQLVITADHETGGLQVAPAGPSAERWRPEVVHGVGKTVKGIETALYANPAGWQQRWHELTGIPLATAATPCVDADPKQEDPVLSDAACIEHLLPVPCQKGWQTCALGNRVRTVINRASHTRWHSDKHTGVDVQVFGYGRYGQQFSGRLDNTDIARKLFAILAEGRQQSPR